MIKLAIAAVILLSSGMVWLRGYWAREKNKNTSRQIVEDLKSGKYVIESYAESLDAVIRNKSIDDKTDLNAFRQFLRGLNGKKLLEKFSVDYGDMDENGNGILIAEAVVKDFVPVSGSNHRELDFFLPCWLYIVINIPGKEMVFRSTFPESKEHHHVLEDLADELYRQFIKQQNG